MDRVRSQVLKTRAHRPLACVTALGTRRVVSIGPLASGFFAVIALSVSSTAPASNPARERPPAAAPRDTPAAGPARARSSEPGSRDSRLAGPARAGLSEAGPKDKPSAGQVRTGSSESAPRDKPLAGPARTGNPPAAGLTRADDKTAAGRDTITLANGLRVLLLQAHSNPMVASTVAVLSGVKDETAATNGASHFLEHLLFNGTPTRTQKQLYDEVDLIGGYNNATTRDEYTLFQFLVHRDRLAEALDIQSDMLFHSTIPQEVFEKERGIVLEEMARDESDPAYGAEQFLRRCWFRSDPRSMPVLGTSESIRAMTREAVTEHYRKHYRPERMVLFLAGDFDREKVLALIAKTFGSPGSATGGAERKLAAPDPLTGGQEKVGAEKRDPSTVKRSKSEAQSNPSAGKVMKADAQSDPSAVEGSESEARGARNRGRGGKPGSDAASGSPAGERASEKRRAQSAGTDSRPGGETLAGRHPSGVYRRRIEGQRGFLRIGVPAPGVGDADVAAIQVAAELLGGQPGTRLGRVLAGEEGSLAMSASTAYVPGPGGGRLEIEAVLAADSDGAGATTAIMKELRRLAEQPVPVEDLRAIATSQKTSALYLRDQIHYLGMSIAPDLILGPSPSLGISDADLSALTPVIVQEAARRWLAQPPVVALSSPAVPEGVDPAAARPLPEIAPAREVPDEQAPGARGAGPAHPSEEGRAVQRVDLDNGLTLLVAENPDSPIFAAHLLVRDRAALEPEGRDGIADVLHRLLPYGSVMLDGEGITAKLAALGAHLKTVDNPDVPYDDYYTSPRYSYVRFETIRENWREGMGLLYSTVAFPRLAERDVALALSEEIDLSRKAAEAPAARARALYARTLLEDGPLARPVTGTPLTLAAIRPPDLRAFHARYFSPENLILSVVSSVPRNDVIELVRSTFGAMPRSPGARDGAQGPQVQDGAAGPGAQTGGPGPVPQTGGTSPGAQTGGPGPEAQAEPGMGRKPGPSAGRPVDTDLPSVKGPGARREPGTSAPPAASRHVSPLTEPPVTEEAARVETPAGKEQSQIYLGGIFARDPADLAPLIVATTILSKRVAQDLRETRGLAYAVGCSLEDFGARAWFTASMGTRPENLDTAEAGLREAIQRFSSADLEPREIERAVNAMRGQMAMRRMTRISQAYSLGFNELLERNTSFDTTLDTALGAVTPADVLRVARRYLEPGRMVTAIAR